MQEGDTCRKEHYCLNTHPHTTHTPHTHTLTHTHTIPVRVVKVCSVCSRDKTSRTTANSSTSLTTLTSPLTQWVSLLQKSCTVLEKNTQIWTTSFKVNKYQVQGYGTSIRQREVSACIIGVKNLANQPNQQTLLVFWQGSKCHTSIETIGFCDINDQ